VSDGPQKVLENRLRRVAARRGLMFQKVRRMDPGASDFGRIHLSDSSGNVVFDGADVREVESFLDGPDRDRRVALGRLLLQVQDDHGWLPAEAAAAHGVAPMTWRRLTSGEPVRAKALASAARALGVPLADVLSALRSEPGMLALTARCSAQGEAGAAGAADEVGRLRAQAEAVRTLHFATTVETTSGPRQMCNHCDTGDPFCTVSNDWPCPTIAALDGAA